MAPGGDEEDMEVDAGQDQFKESLKDFADHRGITVDFDARVNGKHIDLHRLYNTVTERGGYDAVTAEKLAWRTVGTIFNLGNTNAAAYAFALKTLYYKNLVAYEIKHFHDQEPPPTEIVEKLTAKGGDVLGRTMENFQAPPARTGLTNGGSGSEGEESKTPKEDKMEIDEPGSGGRDTRRLRQAPAPRQLFQPDISASRQTRTSSGHLQSPQPAAMAHAGYNYSASSNPNSASFAIQNYEPRPPPALTLRPILTPQNNPALFREKERQAREARRAELGLVSPSTKGMMKPGAGFEGPNIYVRTLQGLRSQIPEEQDYALHHLVKISHERGDKYKFDAFPNLAEGLIEYVLGISSLFYDVKWDISYTDDPHELNTLDGISGTPDILQRISCLKRIDTPDELESEEFAHKLIKTNEAALTIRNLSFLEDNAIYLSEMPQLRDFLSIALNLPALPSVTEIKHYALDIAEQVTRYWLMDELDPLYQTLLTLIDECNDRGTILTALRAVTRISMTLEDTNLLRGVRAPVITRICEWTLLEDEELLGACLDFFYHYTAVPENLAFLLKTWRSSDIPLESFLAQLARLLQHNATTQHTKILLTRAIPATAATEIPTVPDDLMQQFLKFEEPERSNHWLRAVFEEDPESHITQIALWQAYQLRFTKHATQQSGLLPAAEFIKNVSTIFAGANAQVVNGASQKFIIKGIRPRHAPMDAKGRVYTRCLWASPESDPCEEFFLKPEDLFDHIASFHIGMDRNPDGKWNTKSASQIPSDCFWAACGRFSRRGPPPPTALELGKHVRMHLPDTSSKASMRQQHNRTPATQTHLSTHGGSSVDPEQGREATYQYFNHENTAVDNHGNAVGLPLSSVRVLRMIARNMPKAAALLKPDNYEAFCTEMMETLFGALRDKVFHTMTYNKSMATHCYDVWAYVEKGTFK